MTSAPKPDFHSFWEEFLIQERRMIANQRFWARVWSATALTSIAAIIAGFAWAWIHRQAWPLFPSLFMASQAWNYSRWAIEERRRLRDMENFLTVLEVLES